MASLVCPQETDARFVVVGVIPLSDQLHAGAEASVTLDHRPRDCPQPPELQLNEHRQMGSGYNAEARASDEQ